MGLALGEGVHGCRFGEKCLLAVRICLREIEVIEQHSPAGVIRRLARDCAVCRLHTPIRMPSFAARRVSKLI